MCLRRPVSPLPLRSSLQRLFLDGTEFVQVKTRRVIRGGSLGGAPVNLWVEYRDSHPPDGALEFVGFAARSNYRRRRRSELLTKLGIRPRLGQ